MDIRETFEFIVTPSRTYIRAALRCTSTVACVARRTSLFLYIKPRSGREGKGGRRRESPDGDVGDGILIREKIPPLVTEAGWAQ